MFDSIVLLPDAICLQKSVANGGQCPFLLCCFHVLASGFLAMLPNDCSYQSHQLSNGSLVFARWSTCARCAGPGQFPTKPCWWSDWCWDEIEIAVLSIMRRIICVFCHAFLVSIHVLFHIFSTYFHDPFIMQHLPERERESTSVRRVLTLKHKMLFPSPIPNELRNTRPIPGACFHWSLAKCAIRSDLTD